MYIVKRHTCQRCGEKWFPRRPGTPRICKVKCEQWYPTRTEAIAAIERACKRMGIAPPLHYPPGLSSDSITSNELAFPLVLALLVCVWVTAGCVSIPATIYCRGERPQISLRGGTPVRVLRPLLPASNIAHGQRLYVCEYVKLRHGRN